MCEPAEMYWYIHNGKKYKKERGEKEKNQQHQKNYIKTSPNTDTTHDIVLLFVLYRSATRIWALSFSRLSNIFCVFYAWKWLSVWFSRQTVLCIVFKSSRTSYIMAAAWKYCVYCVCYTIFSANALFILQEIYNKNNTIPTFTVFFFFLFFKSMLSIRIHTIDNWLAALEMVSQWTKRDT